MSVKRHDVMRGYYQHPQILVEGGLVSFYPIRSFPCKTRCSLRQPSPPLSYEVFLSPLNNPARDLEPACQWLWRASDRCGAPVLE